MALTAMTLSTGSQSHQALVVKFARFTIQCASPADINCDRKVDILDLTIVAEWCRRGIDFIYYSLIIIQYRL